MALHGFARLLGLNLLKEQKDKKLETIVQTYPSAFARLVLWGAVADGIPDPSKEVTAEQYNALANRVNALDNVLYVNGYNLFYVQGKTMRAQGYAYVPIEDYNEMEARVAAIETLVSAPGLQVFQVKQEQGEGSDKPSPLSPAEGEYVTEEQFAQLADYVANLEALLSSETYTLVMVTR